MEKKVEEVNGLSVVHVMAQTDVNGQEFFWFDCQTCGAEGAIWLDQKQAEKEAKKHHAKFHEGMK